LRDIDLASSIIGNLRDCFMGTDYEYVDSALWIADNVFADGPWREWGPSEPNDDAEDMIRAVGNVLGMVLGWKEISPETIGKVQAIRRIALMDELPEPNRKQQAGMLQ
jgi:hypothetical protein